MLEVNLSVERDDFKLNVSNFTLNNKEIVSIYGRSGSGKTTFLRFIAGFDKHKYGSVKLDGVDITYIEPSRRKIVYFCQKAYLFPHLSIIQNLELNIKDSDLLKIILKKLKIEHLLSRRVCDLSSGERQMIAIVRGIVTKPKVLLLDEATSAIDVVKRSEVLNLLLSMKIPIIYISHNRIEAEKFADRMILFDS